MVLSAVELVLVVIRTVSVLGLSMLVDICPAFVVVVFWCGADFAGLFRVYPPIFFGQESPSFSGICAVALRVVFFHQHSLFFSRRGAAGPVLWGCVGRPKVVRGAIMTGH